MTGLLLSFQRVSSIKINLSSQLEAQFIFTGTSRHTDKEFRSYLQYLEYLSQNRPAPNSYELFAKGYEDYLQSPLQVKTNPF